MEIKGQTTQKVFNHNKGGGGRVVSLWDVHSLTRLWTTVSQVRVAHVGLEVYRHHVFESAWSSLMMNPVPCLATETHSLSYVPNEWLHKSLQRLKIYENMSTKNSRGAFPSQNKRKDSSVGFLLNQLLPSAQVAPKNLHAPAVKGFRDFLEAFESTRQGAVVIELVPAGGRLPKTQTQRKQTTLYRLTEDKMNGQPFFFIRNNRQQPSVNHSFSWIWEIEEMPRRQVQWCKEFLEMPETSWSYGEFLGIASCFRCIQNPPEKVFSFWTWTFSEPFWSNALGAQLPGSLTDHSCLNPSAAKGRECLLCLIQDLWTPAHKPQTQSIQKSRLLIPNYLTAHYSHLGATKTFPPFSTGE